MYDYRTATPADESAVARLIARVAGVADGPGSVHAPVGDMTDPLADPHTLVATTPGDGVVATMSLYLDHDGGDVVDGAMAVPPPTAEELGVDRSESVGYLAYAYVAPPHQSRGVGETMLRRLLAVAVRAGHPRVFVEVWEYDPDRDARGLLRGLGFESVYHAGLSWPDDGVCSECGAADCSCGIGMFHRSLPESVPPHLLALGGNTGGE